jgi:magnesium transporter
VISRFKNISKYIAADRLPALKIDRKAKQTHKAKLDKPPGTLIAPVQDEQNNEPIHMQWFRYDAKSFSERKDDFSIEDVANGITNDTTTWLNIHGLTDVSLIEQIGKTFGLDKLVLEDLLELDQRPKVQEYENYLFFTLKSIRLTEKDDILVEQMSFVLGDNFVISFQEKIADIFEHIRERLRTPNALIKTRKEEYLLYVMIDSIVDHYIILSEDLEDRMEEMQIIVTKNPNAITLADVEELKGIFIKLKRAIWPVRDAVGFLDKGGSGRIGQDVITFYHDLHDLVQTVIDSIDSNRQIMDGVTNIYLSSVSNKMNETMKILTVISSIFIPLTFIAGVYGMNFNNMPELHWEYGYAFTWVVMIIITLGLIYFFKRRGWFD